MHKVKVSVNDQYGLTLLCAQRIDIILELLNVHPLSEWKVGVDAETLTMAGYAKTLEREYESLLSLEDLKVLLKGAEYAKIPSEFCGKLRPDHEVYGAFYIKLCDIDVWVRVSKFPFLSTWDKITSKMVCKKVGINEHQLVTFAIQKIEQKLRETLNKEKINELKSLELEIIRRRMEL